MVFTFLYACAIINKKSYVLEEQLIILEKPSFRIYNRISNLLTSSKRLRKTTTPKENTTKKKTNNKMKEM